MDIRIYDRSLRLCGICDTAVSVSLTEEFRAPGRCSVQIPVREAERFPTDALIRFPFSEETFSVRSVREDTAARTALVTGSGVLSLFSRRILSEPVTGRGTPEELLCSLTEEWGEAVLPGTLYALRQQIPGEGVAATGRTDLLEALTEIAAAAQLGLRLTFLPSSRSFCFSVRTRREIPLFLSRSAGNLDGVVRLRDYSGYKNRVIVRGSAETVTLDAAGLFDDGVDDAAEALRETYDDASDLARDRFASAEEYRAALTERGRAILARSRPRETLTVRVPENTARLLTPGDVCPLADAAVGVFARTLCTARTLTEKKGILRYSVTMQTL